MVSTGYIIASVDSSSTILDSIDQLFLFNSYDIYKGFHKNS